MLRSYSIKDLRIFKASVVCFDNFSLKMVAVTILKIILSLHISTTFLRYKI
jgi:hypothetical protein